MEECVYIIGACLHVMSVLILQDFVYPEDVSFSIGGPDSSKYMVIEMHYDNPVGVSGKRSSFEHIEWIKYLVCIVTLKCVSLHNLIHVHMNVYVRSAKLKKATAWVEHGRQEVVQLPCG